MASVETLRVEVVYSPEPHVIDSVTLQLPAGTTLREAMAASGIAARHSLDAATLRAGIWGRVQEGETVMRDRDRVEIYRPLLVDPKEARRLRYKRAKDRAD